MCLHPQITYNDIYNVLWQTGYQMKQWLYIEHITRTYDEAPYYTILQ